MKVSYLIVSSSSFPRLAIGDEYNTKETRRCPTVLRRQHDYVKQSHCRRVAIESKKFTARRHRGGITVSTKTAEFE